MTVASQPKYPVQARGGFIDGRFMQPTNLNGEWICRNPGDLQDEIARVSYSYVSVNEAAEAAHRAFASWRLTPPTQRAELLKKYQAALGRRQEALIEIMAREVGKPLWEAKDEVLAMIADVDGVLGEGMQGVANLELSDVIARTRGVCRYRPLGVIAVIGPFSSPGQLPGEQIVAALATGNTVIFKPSEKAPIVGQIITECIEEAGFPAGVFNLVQGEREVGRRLCVHEKVAAVLFTGSYEVGTRIKQDTLQQHWKRVVLAMSGKNATIIWDDADLDIAVRQTLFSAFVTAGQRCSSTSRVIVHQSRVSEFVDRLHTQAKGFSIGHPLESPFMGPLVDAGAVDRYLKFIGIAGREGCEIVMRGKALELAWKGHYVAPTICVVQDNSIDAARKSVYQQTELLAPNVAITAVAEVEQAIALSNATQYGWVASVFTKQRAIYEKMGESLEMGLINWNVPTTTVSSRLPVGGLKKSGNHFPAGLLSTRNCTYPVSSLEVAEPK
ncbi:aldehyde dehydrogenase family protein [Bdellovibrionota bacterium FG-1]